MVKGRLTGVVEPGKCTMQSPSLSILAGLAIGLASCSPEQAEFTDTERKCIAQRYSSYDAKQLSQCVDVCRMCLNGNVLTCNTSCKLRGAI
jgi:hypothetical protein